VSILIHTRIARLKKYTLQNINIQYCCK